MLANSGCCMPEPGFLEKLVALCKAHGALSIFDEVITGFRIDLGGARSFFGVVPDLSIYAKALASGFTMAAVGASKEIFSVLTDGRTLHAGTYNGNPINVAAARATLAQLEKPRTFETMHSHGEALMNTIIKAGQGMPLAVTGVGTVFSVHFGLTQPPQNHRETLDADKKLYARFRAALLDKGVQVLPDGRWYVGWAHGKEEQDRACAAIETAMQKI